MIGEIERILDRALILRHGKIVLDEDADTLRQKQGEIAGTDFRGDTAMKKLTETFTCPDRKASASGLADSADRL